MKKKKFKFKLGDKTRDIWSGDIVSDCEYLADLGEGRMLFYDTTCKCFRRVFIDATDGILGLNGWKCTNKPSKLL